MTSATTTDLGYFAERESAYEQYVARSATGNPHEGFSPDDFEAGFDAGAHFVEGLARAVDQLSTHSVNEYAAGVREGIERARTALLPFLVSLQAGQHEVDYLALQDAIDAL